MIGIDNFLLPGNWVYIVCNDENGYYISKEEILKVSFMKGEDGRLDIEYETHFDSLFKVEDLNETVYRFFDKAQKKMESLRDGG